MNKTICFLIVLLSLFHWTNGQDTLPLTRTPYLLSIPVEKNTVYEENIAATAYLLPNLSIQLYSGETVYIEVEQEKGKIKAMHAVKTNSHPEKTVTISFTQTSKNKVHEITMLKLENPFDMNLTYEAMIFVLNSKKWTKTDVYPVEAKLAAYETWSDVITSIGLGHWAFQLK